MEILIVLLAILKYMLLFLLFLLIFIIVLLVVLLATPIRYKVLINYKESDLFLKVNVTYLGKIVSFNLKKNPKKSMEMMLRVFKKTINLTPNVNNENNKNSKTRKNNSSKRNGSVKTNTNTTNSKKNPKENEQSKKAPLSSENQPRYSQSIPLDKNKKLQNEDKQKEISVGVSNISENNSKKENSKEMLSEKDISEQKTLSNSKNSEKQCKDESNSEDSKDHIHSNEDINTDEKTGNDNKKKEPYISLSERLYDIYEKFSYYLEQYENYPYKEKLFAKAKLIFKNLFDSVIPKNFDLSGKIYVSDPALTGKILGGLYMIHGLNSRFNVSIDADFEEEKNDFTSLISGRIIILKMLYPIISLCWLALKAEAKRRKITRIKLIIILVKQIKDK